MGAIRLTERQIVRAAEKMERIFERSVDENKTTYVAKWEVDAFSGKGAASVKKFFKAASMKEGRGEAVSLVKLDTISDRIWTAVETLGKAAESKGNKDGKLDGTNAELGSLKSESTKALARYAHAIKG